jgi:ABC-type antimicrobial peptide transport system permease subunit
VFISLATDGRAETLLPGLRQAVRTVDPELPLEAPGTLADRLAWLTRIPRLFSSFGALGGVVALLVAAIGLYGVMAFHVRSRLPEIGVRMAMGADRRRVAREVLGESIRRVLPGLLVGLVLGGAVGPVVRASVVGTRSVSPALLAAVLLTILATGVVAALAPALRAARVEPLDVLRGE